MCINKNRLNRLVGCRLPQKQPQKPLPTVLDSMSASLLLGATALASLAISFACTRGAESSDRLNEHLGRVEARGTGELRARLSALQHKQLQPGSSSSASASSSSSSTPSSVYGKIEGRIGVARAQDIVRAPHAPTRDAALATVQLLEVSQRRVETSRTVRDAKTGDESSRTEHRLERDEKSLSTARLGAEHVLVRDHEPVAFSGTAPDAVRVDASVAVDALMTQVADVFEPVADATPPPPAAASASASAAGAVSLSFGGVSLSVAGAAQAPPPPPPRLLGYRHRERILPLDARVFLLGGACVFAFVI